MVVGAGGHAKVCVELLRSMGEPVAFCVGGSTAEGTCVGVPVLAGDEHLEALRQKGYGRVFVAIGDNRLRARLGEVAVNLGYQLVNAISPDAVVSASARIGGGIAVMAGAVINAEAEIGDFTIINTGATVDHDCRIGVAAHIAPQSALAGNVVVGSFSFLGIGTVVIPERVIGSDVMTGAGSVVVRDIPDRVTALGVPARVVSRVDATEPEVRS